MPSKILTVNLDTKYYQSSIPVRRISYNQSSIDLSEEEYQDVFSGIPTFWNTDNDKLIRFAFFTDDTYFCERQKKYFNYTTRETDEKIYKFDYGSFEEAKALYLYFVEKYAKIKIARTENLYESIMNEIKDMSFVKFSLLNARNDLLQESDYLMMPDYPIEQEKRILWEEYRQQLRDLTKQEAWMSNNLMEVDIPVSPEPLNQLSTLRQTISDLSAIPDNLTEDIINEISDKPIEDIIKNVTKISVKFELLKSISKMNIPVVGINYEDIMYGEVNYETFLKEVATETFKESTLPKDWWEAATTNIEEKIESVNTMLKSYDVNFTINDILNSIIDQNKLSEEQVEVNQIIEEL